MGLIQNYAGLLAGRWFLGVTEVCLTLYIPVLVRLVALTYSIVWFLPSSNLPPNDLVLAI